MVKIKYKTNLLELFIVCNGGLHAGLAVLGPKALLVFTVFLPPFALPKATCLPPNHSVLVV